MASAPDTHSNVGIPGARLQLIRISCQKIITSVVLKSYAMAGQIAARFDPGLLNIKAFFMNYWLSPLTLWTCSSSNVRSCFMILISMSWLLCMPALDKNIFIALRSFCCHCLVFIISFASHPGFFFYSSLLFSAASTFLSMLKCRFDGFCSLYRRLVSNSKPKQYPSFFTSLFPLILNTQR